MGSANKTNSAGLWQTLLMGTASPVAPDFVHQPLLSKAPTQSTTAMIKQCLVDQFYQYWSANPENSSKHRNYTIFKENIKLEEYFLKLPKFMYECLARFRTGNHRFPCETGRYQGVEYAERKCTLCNLDDVGDEISAPSSKMKDVCI